MTVQKDLKRCQEKFHLPWLRQKNEKKKQNKKNPKKQRNMFPNQLRNAMLTSLYFINTEVAVPSYSKE